MSDLVQKCQQYNNVTKKITRIPLFFLVAEVFENFDQ